MLRVFMLVACVVTLQTVLVAQVNDADKTALAEALTGLQTAVKGKVEADMEHFTKLIAEKWGAADDAQRKEIHGLLPKCLGAKDAKVRGAIVEAIARMGGGAKDKDADTSAKILADETAKKTTTQDLTYHGQVLVAVGKLHSAKYLSFLTKYLGYKDWEVRGSAAEALGFYKDSPMAQKKEAVDAMLKIYNSAWSAANEPRDTTAKNNLQKINRAMEGSLKMLTGVKTGVEGAPAWQKWWNDGGKKAASW
jgi:Na+-translocating ferredoxin:NAD+ oxidoreductase RnfG subunit